MPKSPNNLRLEGGQGDSVDYSMATLSLRPGPNSVNSSRPLAAKALSTDGGINQEKCMTSTCAEAFTSNYESANRKSLSISDQKTLKVRIKMGTDSLSTRKNAAIYSGLGLDVSPSSLDDSSSESEEISRGPHDVPFESPASILQIMSSLPMPLSPLSDDLLQLAGEETCAKDSIPVPIYMDGPESSFKLQLDSNTIKGDSKKIGGKKMKYVDGYGSLIEVKGGTHESARNDVGILSTKEQVIDSLTAEELVSETLKLPLLSSSYSSSDESLKDVGGPFDTLKESNKDMVLEKAFCTEQVQMERVDPTSVEVNGFVSKMKGGSGRKVAGDKVGKFLDNAPLHTVKDNFHGDEIPHSITAESNVDRGRADLSIEHVELPKKTFQKGDLCEHDSTALHVTEHSFPGGKKKLKGSNQTMATESNKEASRAGTLMSKTKNRIDDILMSKNEIEDARLQKDHGKDKDTYRDFFGDLEDDEDRMDSLETLHEDKLKDSEVVKRSTAMINSAVRERSGGKKFDKPLVSEAYPTTATNLVRCSGNMHATESTNGDGAPVTVPPAVIEEFWVQCDKCQKWRILPPGTNPKSLPEKWLCSMLNWLPGMNSCSVSQDETTKAHIALFQVPLPESQSISGSVLMGETSSAVLYPNQNQLNHGLNAMPGGKKRTVKEISNLASKDGSSQLSSSIKKNSQSSMKSRSISDMNKSPAISEPDVRGEKHKTKQKKPESYSDRGDTKNLKAKSCRDADQDYFRQSKKGKTDNMHFTDQQWIPDPSGATRKFHHSLSSSSPTTAAGKEQPKHKDRSSLGDSKYDGKDRLQVSVEKTRDKGCLSLYEESLDLRNRDTIDSVRKRKLKEYQDSGHHHQQESKISAQDEFSRKEKKARLSKSEGRESSISKGSGKTDKRASQTKHQKIRKDPGNTLSQQSLDGADSMKRDLRSVQVSAAATSSSSKVSGSHKTKASFQEVKGSPVESVSSSPLRSRNTEKFTSGELMGKYNSHDAGAIGSPIRCLDGEDDGGSDRSGTIRKGKAFIVVHHGSRGPSMLDFQKDVNHVLDGKSKVQMLPSPHITSSHFTNGGVDTVDQYRKYSSGDQIKDQCQGEDRNDVCCTNNMSNPRKTGQGFSSRLKDNSMSCKSESTAEKVKKTSLSQMQDQPPSSEAKHGDGKVKLQDKLGLKSDRSENIIAGKKDCARNDSRQKDNQLNRGHAVEDTALDAICEPEQLSASGQNHFPDCAEERFSRKSLSERSDQEVLGKGKSLPLPPSGGAQTETLCHGPQPVGGPHQGNGDMVVDPWKVDNALTLQKKQVRKADNQNVTQPISSRHSMLNGHRSKELDAPSPIRRESSGHAANNAMKEAKDLKHLADRLKNSGSSLESTGLYFEAALKFLQGASLLESGNNDNAKYSEMNQAKQIYSSTAKLCEFCAHEFEKLKDMAAAALAYKCMEVAYMRVIYSSHTSASRDQRELQASLQPVPLGESPSSSASDVDNANNSAAADKTTLSKGVSPPQVVGNHVIAAQNRPKVMRLLKFAQDVNFAMEASRKSRIAFAVASSSSCEVKHAEGTSPIKKALDFNFQDVEGLLRLVRLAMEAINR
ncbi:cysteine-tryptophan domain-containing zinc finger protein 3-like isoform X2 [Prosopis cineraria]|nr:cysteine-tryptophan domain-containing zinc finger protein 3-like isoform X2 [Prosopis cineraria]XP_054792127.1 cysteine-tryptophan domain-containing zinc finger protein 3-like isoform X2 [Prosopis cineraria]XP_054792761.1 cysteine-tryptophan domain-containing zinc finger protein 3-like isoform X2 [Prosopis cineraria]